MDSDISCLPGEPSADLVTPDRVHVPEQIAVRLEVIGNPALAHVIPQ